MAKKKFRGRWLSAKMLRQKGACDRMIEVFIRYYGDRVFVTEKRAAEAPLKIARQYWWVRDALLGFGSPAWRAADMELDAAGALSDNWFLPYSQQRRLYRKLLVIAAKHYIAGRRK